MDVITTRRKLGIKLEAFVYTYGISFYDIKSVPGKELYTDRTSIRAQEENAKSEVNLLYVAFWPEGSALCLFYGPTPISKPDKIEPYSPVNIVGHIVTEQRDIINKVKATTKVIIKQ